MSGRYKTFIRCCDGNTKNTYLSKYSFLLHILHRNDQRNNYYKMKEHNISKIWQRPAGTPQYSLGTMFWDRGGLGLNKFKHGAQEYLISFPWWKFIYSIFWSWIFHCELPSIQQTWRRSSVPLNGWLPV